MGIIIKFMLKNIKEKKFRTFLILFSIIISSALFFASGAIAGNMEKIYIEQMKRVYGTADIIIHPSEKSPSSFYYMNRIESFRDYFEYAVGTVETSGIYKPNSDEEVRLSIKGISFNDLQTMNPIILRNEYENIPFTGNKIIIGKSTAEKYKLKAGDIIEIEIRESKRKFLISGISEPMGLFVDVGQNVNAVVPRETVSGLYNSAGAVTNIYIKVKDPVKEQLVIQELSNVYKQYTVRETVSQQDINGSSAGLTSAFMIMVVTLLLMSMFIIYTSFKVITMERLPVLGTFRSIGATRRTTNLMLLLESVFYGILGGMLGCCLGIGVLYLITYFTTPAWLRSVKISVTYTSSQLISAFLMAVILSFISSLIPIIRISRIPVKDIVLNKLEKHSKNKSWKLFLGIGLMMVSIPVRNIPAKKLGVLLDGGALSAQVAGSIILVPYLTGIFIKFFEKLYNYVFGNEGVLAVKNLRDNKNVLNNIVLLSIGISTLLMINTLSYSVGKEVLDVFSRWNCEIQMSTPNGTRDTERIIERIEGVEGVYGVYALFNVTLGDGRGPLIYLQGVNRRKFMDFFSFTFEGDPDAMFEILDEGRNAITSKIFKDKYGLKEGDTITIKLNNRMQTYKIIGFFDSLMMNGSYVMISERYFKLDTGEKYFNSIYIKTNKDPDAVVESIKKQFKRKSLWIQTVKQSEDNNQKSNEQIFSIMKGFSIMTMVVGIFGVLNNFLISFMERRRSLAMLRSMGMSKKQIVKMIFIEALTGGFIGGIVGIAGGYMMLLFVPNSHVMKEVAAPIPMHFSMSLFVYSMIAGIIITLIASISPAMKSSKLNIIESIKYE